MAYTYTNPYFPASVNPSALNPTTVGGINYSPSYGQTAVPLQTQQQTSLLTVFVDSEAEVNDYPVAAGTTVQLISFKMGKFYLKSTATNGVPQPIRVFSFTEETTAPEIQNGAVSRDAFDALNAKLDKLIAELGGDK